MPFEGWSLTRVYTWLQRERIQPLRLCAGQTKGCAKNLHFGNCSTYFSGCELDPTTRRMYVRDSMGDGLYRLPLRIQDVKDKKATIHGMIIAAGSNHSKTSVDGEL